MFLHFLTKKIRLLFFFILPLQTKLEDMENKCYRSINKRTKMVEAIKFLEWSDEDPKSLTDSKLIKYERVKITVSLVGNNCQADITTQMSDRQSMMGVKEIMLPISEEEYREIANSAKEIVNQTKNVISKLNSNL